MGLEERDLFAEEPGQGRSTREIVASYDYVNETDNLLYQVVRLFPKDFRQRRPDGRGGWIWKLGNTRRVPYRLPELIEGVALGKLVHVVEGEKDADRLVSLGLVATTNAGGAGTWRSSYGEFLRGARVAILPDSDDSGRAHARMVANALCGIAEDIRIVGLPGVPEKGDVSDWLDTGGTVEELQRLVDQGRSATSFPYRESRPDGSDSPDRFGFVSLSDLLGEPEPAQEWLVPGQLPAGGNILVAGSPKSLKTYFSFDLGISLVTGTPFLSRYRVEPVEHVAIIIMEGPRYQAARRLERLCNARGVDPRKLDGRLSVSHRPDLRLSDEQAVVELGEHLKRMGTKLLIVDAWQYVATGNSNDADEVTPQLMALSSLRDVVPDLTVLLIHHARKQTADAKDERLTDLIRGSGAFGAWYDCGVALSRKDEDSPVSVRTELRDYETPKPFRFTASYTPDPFRGRGALSLVATDRSPAEIRADQKAENVIDGVRQYVAGNPGCSKRTVGSA